MRHRGRLELLIGNMFSNKTGKTILDVETLRDFGEMHVVVFKPKTDNRSGRGWIRSRHNKKLRAFEVPPERPQEVFEILRRQEKRIGRRADCLVFDEIQFFSLKSKFFWVVNDLLNDGYDIIAAGLPLDFRGEPFGSTLALTWFANINCVWLLSAHCAKCRKAGALFAQRTIGGKPAPYRSRQVMVGDKELYYPACHEHFVIPGRPSLR